MNRFIARFRGRRGGTRGATLVEYSLMAGLIAVVLIGAVQAMTDSASDELTDRGGEIGYPSQATGIVTTTTAGPVVTTTSTSTTSTTIVTYSIGTSCTGTGGNSNQCTFTLTPDPGAATVAWSIDPASGYTGTPPVVMFTQKGKRTVQVTVDGVQVDPIEVDCKETGQEKFMQCS